MKYKTVAVVALLPVFVSLATINWCKVPVAVEAQERKPATKTDAPAKSGQPERQKSELSDDQPFPTFFVDDVISRLTDSIDELLEKKIAKSSDELKKDLDQTEFSITLVPAAAKELPPGELYRRAIESIYLVAGLTKPTEQDTAWKTAFSTAFAVHENGILSTSSHVFDHDDHDDAVIVMDVKGNIFPVIEILATNRKADTCLFRIDAKKLTPLPLGKPCPPGTPIRVIGHPGDSFFYFSAGHIANYERDEDGRSWLNITADFGQGSSGGPVMDDAGNVVGQVSRTYTLYAGGESSNRHQRFRSTRAVNDIDPPKELKDVAAEDESDPKKKPDPQMVFKACTPVSAIRALVK